VAFAPWRAVVPGTVVGSHGASGEIRSGKPSTIRKMAWAGTVIFEIPERLRHPRRTSHRLEGTRDKHHSTEHLNWKHDQGSAAQTGNAETSLLYPWGISETKERGLASKK
jgi:hypothetical protein